MAWPQRGRSLLAIYSADVPGRSASAAVRVPPSSRNRPQRSYHGLRSRRRSPEQVEEAFYRLFLRVPIVGPTSLEEDIMKGYVRQRRGRYYAVVYEGRDPVTGKERRSWHPAGTDQAEAERLAAKLAAEEKTKVDAVR
jgi:hypothetical protein